MHPIVAAIVLVVMVAGLGYWLVTFVRDPYATLGRRGKASSAAGSVLQDLDRLLARPSVEHKIEVENRIQDRDDAIGGE
jgi:hypothetical protein